MGMPGTQVKGEPNTDHVIDDLNAYLDGELDGRTRARVEAHLAACDACALQYRTLQQTKKLMATAPRLRAPRNFTIREIEVAPRKAPRRLSWGVILARAAAPVVGVMMVLSVAGDLFSRQYAPMASPAPVAYSSAPAAESSAPTVGALAVPNLQSTDSSATGPADTPPPPPTVGRQAAAPPAAQGTTVPTTVPPSAPEASQPVRKEQPTPEPTTGGVGVAAVPVTPAPSPAAPQPTSPGGVGIAAAPTETPLTSEEAARATGAPKGMGGEPQVATPEPTSTAPPTSTPPATATATPTATATATETATPTAEPSPTGETMGARVDTSAPGASEQAPQAVSEPWPAPWVWHVAEAGTGGLFLALLLIAVLGGRLSRG
jgi:hypothetical protein